MGKREELLALMDQFEALADGYTSLYFLTVESCHAGADRVAVLLGPLNDSLDVAVKSLRQLWEFECGRTEGG